MVDCTPLCLRVSPRGMPPDWGGGDCRATARGRFESPVMWFCFVASVVVLGLVLPSYAMVEEFPSTSTEQRLKDQHKELLLHLDGWFERVDTTISRLGSPSDHAPVTHLLPTHPRTSVRSYESQSKESKETIGDPSHSFRKEKAPSIVHSEPSLRNSRTSMKRLDSYTVAVKKSSRISESFKQVWSKDGSHTSMQVHRQNPSRCKRLWSRLVELSERIIHSQWANLFFGAAILSNSLFLGIQLQYRAQNPGPSDTSIVFFVIHTLYAALFTVELLLRLLGEGFWDFFFSSSWTWNWLDARRQSGILSNFPYEHIILGP